MKLFTKNNDKVPILCINISKKKCESDFSQSRSRKILEYEKIYFCVFFSLILNQELVRIFFFWSQI